MNIVVVALGTLITFLIGITSNLLSTVFNYMMDSLDERKLSDTVRWGLNLAVAVAMLAGETAVLCLLIKGVIENG